jgi:hypothetical protein
MRETWLAHNTDKMVILFLVVMLWFSTLWAALHIFHHDIDNMAALAFISFMTGAVSTVLGALVMIMTGRIQRADGPHPTPSPTPSPNPPPSGVAS